LGSETAAVETLDMLRQARDLAKERYDDAVEADESLSVAVTVGDWDDLSLEGRRDLIKTTISRVVVHPGRGMVGSRSRLADAYLRAGGSFT
jgi:hypothetical protein